MEDWTIAVQCRNLSKQFGEQLALNALTLDVYAGEVLALLGPSGCGKTTTLRLIAGFEHPDGGEIVIGGQVVAGPSGSLPPEKRRVGMVFQNYALFPHLTVADNVAFGLLKGGDKAARVADLLALVGLTGYGDRMPHELSGGQQQRVAIARALAPEPAVLLLDEPFSNLDTGRRLQMREEVREILRRSAKTAIFVTHSQEEALFMGDRVAVMDGGQLVQLDTPEVVYHQPATRFVADFMGETDFLPGRVTPGGIETEIGCVPQESAYAVGTPVAVALRADDVMLSAANGAGGNGVVVRRLFRGAVAVYRVQLESGRVVHSLQAHTATLAEGDVVRVSAAPGHALAHFEGEAGRG